MAAPALPLSIYCIAAFLEPVMEALTAGIGEHQLLMPPLLQTSNLAVGSADPLLADADIAFGQPDPTQVLEPPRLKWIHLTTAGYTWYDTAEMRK
jgi:hypothetical protein